MTNKETQELIQVLVDAFPNAKAEEGTIRLYRRTMSGWRYDVGRKAVDGALETCSFLPSIAELVQQYSVAAEQHRRRLEEERTKLERLAEDNMPRPPLKEIPTVREHLDKLWQQDVDDALTLESAHDGECFDCGKVGPRFKLGPNGFCASCVAPRLRARVEAA